MMRLIEAKIYFDTRRLDKEGRGQVRIRISKFGKAAMFGTGVAVLPGQWYNNQVVEHPQAPILNSIIQTKLVNTNRLIIEKAHAGDFAGKTAAEIAEILKVESDPDYVIQKEKRAREWALRKENFLAYYGVFMKKKTNPGTHQLYDDTFRKITSFCDATGEETSALTFAHITKSWLMEFEQFCLKTERQNTASRHLRDIRAVFNAAIDDGLTTNYPFRKFKIKKEESRDKSYSAEELRRLFAFKSRIKGEQEALDIFKLQFLLIGINSGDLANCAKPERGRIEYRRAKTHKLYSVKLLPEAEAIVKRYAGKKHLLNLIERSPNYKTYFRRLAKNLKSIGMHPTGKSASKCRALFPGICPGSARTSWATIAQEELDIPRDVIAAALGHHTIDVTTTYLRTEWRKKIDDANRRVADLVLYNKV